MSVCLLAEPFSPVVGGAESHSKPLTRELVNRGHDVVVGTPGSFLRCRRLLESMGQRLFAFRRGSTRGRGSTL
jgi:hypothetical protein